VRKLTRMLCAGAAVASMSAGTALGVEFRLNPIGTHATGIFDEGAAEIVAYDKNTFRLFVINADAATVDILDITDPTNPTLFTTINTSDGGPNSVAVKNGIVAVAVENSNTQADGFVKFYDANGVFQSQVTVGALPDMVTFTPDGKKLLVANEGEPNDDYDVDPEGSISIVDLSGGVGSATVSTADFSAFNGMEAALEATGVRIFGPGASVAQDLEPEYIGVSQDGKTAFVALQENNAIAVLDLETEMFTAVNGLGFKDHSLPGNELDANQNDDQALLENLPVFGMFMPDGIATYDVDGKTFIVTANEGDSRDYDGFSEEVDLKDVTLDTAAFAPAFVDRAGDTNDIGDLLITDTMGDTDNDGEFEEIFTFGGRSFSIFDEDGNLVFDSGDQFERITAELLGENFNSNNDENNSGDKRSDAKGPEPEGVTIGRLLNRTLAFIGLERVGGVMVYDITDPTSPFFVSYVNNRNFDVEAELSGGGTNSLVGDLGPEGLLFISAEDSPTGRPLLAVGNEVSGTTTIYSITPIIPEPATLGLAAVAGLALVARRRR